MSFLHTGLLWFFLPLAIVPLLLHLLTLKRLRTVELSTFRFLFDSYVQQRRRMKLLEILLAVLRTLFLLLLVLSLARPVVRHWDALLGVGGSGHDVVLLMDTSASMAARTGGETSLRRAQRAATKVVDRLSSQDRVTLIRVGAKPVEVCRRFSSDAEAIRNEIEALSVSSSRANWFAAFSQLFGSESRALNKPVVYLFSDLQASGWREFEEAQSGRVIPPGTEMVAVNVGSQEQLPNFGMVGGAPEQQRALVGLPIKLRPRVGNFSPAGNQTVEITFIANEKEIVRKPVTVRPSETEEIELLFVPQEPGILRGEFRLPEDRFPDDDRFRFTVDVAPRVEVVLINGNPAAEPLDNEGLYLRTAMMATSKEKEEAQAAEGKDKPLAADNELARALHVVDVPEAALNEELVREADVVILANCGGLQAPAQFNLLTSFVARGGGLLILPGERVNADVYNQQFLSAPNLADADLTSARLGPLEGDPATATTFTRFRSVDLAHPVLSVFAESKQKYLSKVSFYRRFALQIPKDDGSCWPLAHFENGAPALVESRLGEGRVVLSALPFNQKWSNLPMRPEFVPLVLRLVSYLKRPAELQGPSVVIAGTEAEFVVAHAWAPASAAVTDTSGHVTPIPLKRSNTRLVGGFERTDKPGYYSVGFSGGGAEKPKRGTLAFAVNLEPQESDFQAMTKSGLAALLPSTKLTVVDASAEAQQQLGSIGEQREIWRPLIALVFVIIGIEFFLATLGGHQTGDEQHLSATERFRELARGGWVGRMTGADIEEVTQQP